MEAPERIYLQLGKTEADDDWDNEVGVTWCVDRINDSDAEYVRRDVAVKLREALDWYRVVTLADPGPFAELYDATAFLADSPEPLLSPDSENAIWEKELNGGVIPPSVYEESEA